MARGSKRLLVTTADQLASSLSNFVLIFSLARTANPSAFGVYALAIGVLSFALAIARSVIATPFTIDSVARTAPDGASRVGTTVSVARSAALSLTLGLGMAAAMTPFVVVAGLHSTGLVGVLVILTLALPALMIQDFLRYVAIARARPLVALLSDASWTGLLLALFAFQVVATRPVSPVVCAAVWVIGLVIATVVLTAAGLAERPRTRGMLPWLLADPRHRQLAGEALISGGGPIVLLTMVGVLCGSANVAALRGASTVFGPLNTLLTATILGLVPEVRRLRSARGDRLLIGATALICLGATVFGLVMSFVLPDRFGMALLGNTWSLTHRVLLATTFEYIGVGLITGGIIWCRAKNRVDVGLRWQVIHMGGVFVTTALTGVAFGDARAVATGFAVVGIASGAGCIVSGARLPHS